MASMTVSKALELQKTLKERRNSLKELVKENDARTHWMEPKKTEEPLYDATCIDEMVLAIDKALFDISATLKASNAVVTVEIQADYDQLMVPIRKK